MSPASTSMLVCTGILMLWAPLCSSAPRYDQEDVKSLERETQALRDAAATVYQLLRVAEAGWGPTSCHQKRNSEIISTVLGLPKTITDAGRK